MSMSEVDALAALLSEALVALEQADPAAAAAIVGPTRPHWLTPEEDARLIKRADTALAAAHEALHPVLAERLEEVVERCREMADEIEEAA
ncbi:hypothetical protein AZL_013850 [Azospirillum sp. B510]|uniref:hypothetical protein n=1 Tax=Azospirillum sp. (strain B510) TaxID=137722 RepID=UPI0001C4C384|nr:hypothetical protein [Azospirillum sp. B510]BAI72023.1 hypothetical protein AZL_013850 [Azospirillum sp. B510]